MIHLVGDINILNVGDIEPRDYSDAIPGGSDLEALKNEIRNLAASHQASLFCSTHCRWFRSFNNSTWSCGKIRLLLLWPSLPLILLLALMSTEKHRFSPRHERFLDAPLGRVQALIWEFISLISQRMPCQSSVTSLSGFFFFFFFFARGWDLMRLCHEQRKKKWRYSYNYSDVALIFFFQIIQNASMLGEKVASWVALW